jgi:hypothetical protein
MFYIDLDTRFQDRFDLAKFMDFTNDGVFDPLNSYMLLQIPLLSPIGEYTIRKEAGRPDNLSYVIYGDTQYWWVLMWYNKIYKPEDIKIGMKIKYPSISSIEQLYMNASLYQKTI